MREAARLKRMGTRKGVFDYHLPVARGAYHSLWVELKADVTGYNPKTTPEQYDWRLKMRDQGNAAFIIKGWEAAISAMLLYLKLEPGETMTLQPDHLFDKSGFDNV